MKRSDRLVAEQFEDFQFNEISLVQLERVNPRPFSTLSARESEWAKAEVVLKSSNSVFERKS
ncbi:hypothetical protein H5410_027706 [Solanum commersonii]|uniref:Uncharacterized protein n=1 Tax=Solanum commersonii TaxID=4109 RepID=A0A9J5Z594_SOLCO|nr:hypothetical protein H5410_027706 [Solanum commersonii]